MICPALCFLPPSLSPALVSSQCCHRSWSHATASSTLSTVYWPSSGTPLCTASLWCPRTPLTRTPSRRCPAPPSPPPTPPPSSSLPPRRVTPAPPTAPQSRAARITSRVGKQQQASRHLVKRCCLIGGIQTSVTKEKRQEQILTPEPFLDLNSGDCPHVWISTSSRVCLFHINNAAGDSRLPAGGRHNTHLAVEITCLCLQDINTTSVISFIP